MKKVNSFLEFPVNIRMAGLGLSMEVIIFCILPKQISTNSSEVFSFSLLVISITDVVDSVSNCDSLTEHRSLFPFAHCPLYLIFTSSFN